MTEKELLSTLGLKRGKQDVGSYVLPNGKTVDAQMKEYAKIAMKLLEANVVAAYKPGTPVRYKRTGGVRDATRKYKMSIAYSGQTVVVTCEMGDTGYHPALFGEHAGEMWSALSLMDTGYEWRNARTHIPYLTRRPKGDIIANTMAQFAAHIDPALPVELTINLL